MEVLTEKKKKKKQSALLLTNEIGESQYLLLGAAAARDVQSNKQFESADLKKTNLCGHGRSIVEVRVPLLRDY